MKFSWHNKLLLKSTTTLKIHENQPQTVEDEHEYRYPSVGNVPLYIERKHRVIKSLVKKVERNYR